MNQLNILPPFFPIHFHCGISVLLKLSLTHFYLVKFLQLWRKNIGSSAVVLHFQTDGAYFSPKASRCFNSLFLLMKKANCTHLSGVRDTLAM